MRFIDLFAGLGGFHEGLRHEHTCVFASEIDPTLRALYYDNFGLLPAGDIRAIRPECIPEHELLCAGFPCQPFSKAGSQLGLDDLNQGQFVNDIIGILEYHLPRFLLLENVPNLIRHRSGTTWQNLKQRLDLLGYHIDFHHYSPHHFGIPHNRKRVFIVGDRIDKSEYKWPSPMLSETSIDSVLDDEPQDARFISETVVAVIAAWQVFLDRFPKEEQLPSFPIWGMEFGATYPFEGTTPAQLSTRELWQFHGAHGVSLHGLDRDAIFALLPSYARSQETSFAVWKEGFIRQNRELYRRHQDWLDEWRVVLRSFAPSYQKFEWNAQGRPRAIVEHILQVRASGLRVKRPSTSPSLVAMTTTQTPIIGWEGRYMTVRECARLQSLDRLTMPATPGRAYTALGNAVNATIVAEIAKLLLARCESIPCSLAELSQSIIDGELACYGGVRKEYLGD